VTRSALPKLRAYPALAAAALFAAIVLGRPELVSLAVPFALFLAVGLARLPAPDVTLGFAVEPARVVEGDEVQFEVDARSTSGVERLELRPALPERLEWSGPPPVVFRLGPGEERTFELRLRCTRFGAYRVGGCEVRAFDAFGLVVDAETVEPELALRVYPGAERLKRLVDPAETQPHIGNQVARAKGEGIEFADIRPFSPGDRVRRINWRASARRQVLQVNESHPERNADVVLFLDTFAEARSADSGTLDRTIRAAAALAQGYLGRRDRVGVVGFGGVVRWLAPSSGRIQLYRIVETLIETEIAFSYAWKKIDLIPPRTLPPQSLVLALSPLLDGRVLDALIDMHARGFDLAIVDVSPFSAVEPLPTEGGRLAFRLWQLWRNTLHDRYRALGVPVVDWREGVDIVAALEEVRSYRRRARIVRV
jgi:uncharacterized protein (DUF58 family)